MLLKDYIANRYGTKRGSKKRFLEDNPHIIDSALSRYLRNGWKIDLSTAEIYKPTVKINLSSD